MAASSHSTQGNVSQIFRKGVDLTTQNAIPIPQTENPSSKEAQHSSGTPSTLQKGSSGSSPLCFRCMKYYSKGHEKECKALKDKCNFCG